MSSGDEGVRDAEVKSHASAELLAALGDLLAAIRAVELPFDSDKAQQTRETRDEVADQLSDYVLPRLVQFDAPLLTVVGGSTGAGKSTLVNSVVGDNVSEAGVLRPTTRSPVLVHHPDDAEWFSRDRLLPDLPRSEEQEASGYGLRIVATDLVPPGVALLDAPDVDSVDTTNRALATQLLAAADMWLFVTSAARYADQVPWDYLRRATDRSTSLAVVLDRTASDALGEVRSHLARMMTARGLADSPLFTVTEAELDSDGLLPKHAVAPIASWISDLGANPSARRMVVGRTLDGAVRHIVLRAHDIADNLAEQHEIAAALNYALTSAFEAAHGRMQVGLTDGSLLAGDLLARWRGLAAKQHPAATRSPLTAPATESDPSPIEVDEATLVLRATLSAHLIENVSSAVDETTREWSQLPAGLAVLEQNTPRFAEATRDDARSVVRAWVRHISEQVDNVRSKSDADARPSTNAALITLAVAVAALGGPKATDESVVFASRLAERALEDAHARAIIDDARSELEGAAGQVSQHASTALSSLVLSPDGVSQQIDEVRAAARNAEHARHADFVNGEIAP